MLEEHPAADGRLDPRAAPFVEIAREIMQMRRRLRELRFDIAIDVQCLTKSAMTAWLSGARRRMDARCRRPRTEPLVQQRAG